jgi:hypothetical protein
MLNEQQTENWREVLFQMFGPYAFFMTPETIQAFHDKFQGDINRLSTAEPALCTCDPNHEGKTVHKDGSVECNKCHRPRKP